MGSCWTINSPHVEIDVLKKDLRKESIIKLAALPKENVSAVALHEHMDAGPEPLQV